MKKKASLIIIGVLASQLAFGFGSKLKMGGDKEDAASKGNLAEVVSMQDDLVNRYATAFVLELEAKALLVEALGSKEEAAKISVEAESFKTDGIVSKKNIERAQKTSLSTDKVVDDHLAAASELSGDSKKTYVQSLVVYAQGVKETKDLLPKLTQYSEAAAAEISNADFKSIKKVKGNLETGMYLAKILPNQYKNMSKTGVKMFDYAKKNEIPVPKEASQMMSFD